MASPLPDPMAAAEIAAIYEVDGPSIFDRSAVKIVTSANGLLDERYDSDGPGRLAAPPPRHDPARRGHDAGRPARLRPRGPPGAVAALDADDVSMVDAAHATSAAPTYFEPVRLGARTLVDGGVFAINPAVFAYAEAGGETRAAALARHRLTHAPAARSSRSRTGAGWNGPSRSSTSSSTAPRTPSTPSSPPLAGERYLRLQTRLEEASDDLDDASPENLAALRREAERLIAERDADIDRACAILTA